MLHAKFQDNRTFCSGGEDFLKVFTIFGHCDRLGNKTLTIHVYKLCFPHSQGTFTLNFASIGQADSEKMFENNGHVLVYSHGSGKTVPWCQNLFKNINILLFWSFTAGFTL